MSIDFHSFMTPADLALTKVWPYRQFWLSGTSGIKTQNHKILHLFNFSRLWFWPEWHAENEV